MIINGIKPKYENINCRFSFEHKKMIDNINLNAIEKLLNNRKINNRSYCRILLV